MTTTGPFVLDSDVFIAAKNAYDAFTICPGFWASLIGHHEAGNVISIDRVSDELLMGRETEDLVRWVRTHVPETFFRSTAELPVAEAYTEIMTWVQRSTRYADAAKSKFATGADGWLVAYARVHELTLATNEQPRPEARNQIKLPDVCMAFEVAFCDTFEMLHALGTSYSWDGMAGTS